MDYWIAKNNEKIGPLSLQQLLQMDIEPDTLVWHDGLPTWCKAGSLPELAGTLSGNQTNHQDSAPAGQSQESQTVPPVYNRPSTTQAAAVPPPMPPTYLGWTIAAIILCCMIPAIVALVYSLKVSSRYYAGDFDGAQAASDRAELWLIISIVVGLVAAPFYIVMSAF